MEKWKKRSVELFSSLAFGGENISVVPYYPQKTAVSNREERFFRRCTPEEKGISSARLYNMLAEIEAERRSDIHSITVLCGGEIISECYAKGYSPGGWHISHSMSKTVCGMIIGKLVDEGKVSTEALLVEIFPEISYKDRWFPQITIDHLLCMCSGVDFAEAGSVTDSEWTKTFFSSPLKFAPGSQFHYNSMNSYILARVAEQVSGRRFGDLAREYIFDPLEIKNYLWEKGPEGTEKGGWGLYLSAESWCKLGFMVLREGEFLGRQILSPQWIRRSSSLKAVAPLEDGNFNYAYQMWTGRESNEILFNGMFGQNVWICPRNDIVVVMNSGNNELFGASPALETIRKHLGGRINDKFHRKDIKLLRNKENSFFDNRRWIKPQRMFRILGVLPIPSVDKKWENIAYKYGFAQNNISLLPLLVGLMQNNMSGGIKSLEISVLRNGILLEFVMNSDKHRIVAGIYDYKESLLNFCGEQYKVKAIAGTVSDSDGNIEYKIEIIFTETASRRFIKIKELTDGTLEIAFGESPDEKIAESFFDRSKKESKLHFIINILERRLGDGGMKELLRKTFNPCLIGARTDLENYDDIINQEEKKNRELSAKTKILLAVVEKLFKENQ